MVGSKKPENPKKTRKFQDVNPTRPEPEKTRPDPKKPDPIENSSSGVQLGLQQMEVTNLSLTNNHHLIFSAMGEKKLNKQSQLN